MYDFQLYQRDKLPIKTVVIYTADVKQADVYLNMGSLQYKPDKVMMAAYDGNAIFKDLENKITANKELADIDMMNLIFVPLMKNDIPKTELAVKSLKLAQSIQDQQKRYTCLASVYAFASKYLDQESEAKLLEVLKLSDLLAKYVEEEVRKGIDEGLSAAKTELKLERKLEVATELLRLGHTVEEIAKATKLEIAQIEKLKENLKD